MKRFACHHLYVSTDGCYYKYVVELEENGAVGKYFPLVEEISATLWIGGVIVLSPYSEIEIHPQEAFACFLRRVIVEMDTDEPVYAWHIADFDFTQKDFKSTSKVTRL